MGSLRCGVAPVDEGAPVQATGDHASRVETVAGMQLGGRQQLDCSSSEGAARECKRQAGELIVDGARVWVMGRRDADSSATTVCEWQKQKKASCTVAGQDCWIRMQMVRASCQPDSTQPGMACRLGWALFSSPGRPGPLRSPLRCSGVSMKSCPPSACILATPSDPPAAFLIAPTTAAPPCRRIPAARLAQARPWLLCAHGLLI